MIRAELDHHVGQLEHAVEIGDERARSALHVEHEAVEILRELLAHDARGDERNRLDGRGGVAQRVHLLVGGRDLGRLADHRAAVLLDLCFRLGEREVGAEAGDRLELVERSTGVAERATGHHRHRDAERRDERREHERDFVADAAGRVLVDARAADVREIEPVAAQQHRVGERGGFRAVEATEKARHEERGHLIVGDVTLGVGQGERAPLAGIDPAAIALSLDQAMCEH